MDANQQRLMAHYSHELANGTVHKADVQAAGFLTSGQIGAHGVEVILIRALTNKMLTLRNNKRRKTTSSLEGIDPAAVAECGFSLGSICGWRFGCR